MEKQLHNILNALYEAESLIEMALRRGADENTQIARLAVEKCFHAADLAAALKLEAIDSSEKAPEPTPATALEKIEDIKDPAEELFEQKIAPALGAPEAEAEILESEAIAKVAEEAETTNYTSDIPVTTDKKVTDTAVSSASVTEEFPSMQQLIEGSQEESEAETGSSDALATIDASEISQAGSEQEEAENLEALHAIEAESAEDATPDEQPATDSADFPTQNDDYEYEEEDEEEEEEEPARPVARPDRKPIATFFSINDKFRFRRELFGNSNPEWLNALALLETMNDMHEADDFLFNDLQWDPESDDVKAFIRILERYYKS